MLLRGLVLYLYLEEYLYSRFVSFDFRKFERKGLFFNIKEKSIYLLKFL